MPRIPGYERQVDPRVGASFDAPRVGPDAFGAQVGDVLQAIGGRMQQVDERKRREAEAAADDAAAVDAARLFEETNAAAEKARATLREQASGDGAGHAETVLSDFDRRRDAALEGITNPKARKWAELQFIRLRGNLDVQESGYAAGLRATKIVTDYSTARDLAANALYTRPDPERLVETLTAHRALVAGLSVSEEIKGKLNAENVDRFGSSYVQGLAERDPYEARRQIDGGALNAVLNPEDMARLRNRVDTEIRGREAQARMEENQRRAEARAAQAEARRAQAEARAAFLNVARDLQDGLAAGVNYSPAEIAAVSGQAARLPGGQALARNIATLGEKNATLTELRGARPVEVQTAINGLTAELAKGGANAPVIKARLDAALAFKAKQDSELRTDPLSYATTQGVVALAPIDFADPASLARRGKDAWAVKARYGGPLTVLTDEEAADFGARLSSADPNQKMQALRQLRAMGSTGAAAAMRQIAPQKPVEARAGVLLGTAGGVPVARTILDGQALLKDNPKLVPETNARRVAATDMGAAFKFFPDLAMQIPDTARAYYAGWKQREGEEGFDALNFRQSLNAAAGGVRGNDGVMRGGLGKRSGHVVLLPDGKSETEFNTALEGLSAAATPAALKPVWADGSEVSDAQLRSARPFAVGPGRYFLATDAMGNNLIMRRNGQPFEVLVK